METDPFKNYKRHNSTIRRIAGESDDANSNVDLANHNGRTPDDPANRLSANRKVDIIEFGSSNGARLDSPPKVPPFPFSPLKLPSSALEQNIIAADLTSLGKANPAQAFETPPVSPKEKSHSLKFLKFWKWGKRAKYPERSDATYNARTNQKRVSTKLNVGQPSSEGSIGRDILHISTINARRSGSKVFPSGMSYEAPQSPVSDRVENSLKDKISASSSSPTSSKRDSLKRQKEKGKALKASSTARKAHREPVSRVEEADPPVWHGFVLWLTFILVSLAISLAVLLSSDNKPVTLLSGTVATTPAAKDDLLPGVASVNLVPIPVKSRQVKANEFAADRAWSHMQTISMRRRPHNSFAIVDTAAYIANFLSEMQPVAAAAGKRFEVYGEDSVVYTDVDNQSPSEEERSLFVESSNLVARLYGGQYVQTGPALLLLVNYDSAPASYGASSNGVGVGVLLETMRLLIQGPLLPCSIIFLFTSMEELGGLGVRGFTKHPWFMDVRTFISLNSVGAGGKVAVTKSNDHRLNDVYSKSVPYPNVNALICDVYSWYWRSFASSYYVLATEKQLPGIELGFVENRGVYQSSIDDPYHVPLYSVQTMGSNLLAMARALAGNTNGNSFVATTGKVIGVAYQQPVNVDIVGGAVLGMSMQTLLIIQSVMLFLQLALLAIGCSIRGQRCPYDVLRGCFVLVGAVLLSFALSVLLNLIVWKSNAIAPYVLGMLPYLYLVFFFIFSVTLFTALGWKWLSKGVGNRESRAQVLLYSQLLFWCFALLLSTIVAAAGRGVFYYIFWFSLCQFVSLAVFELLCKSSIEATNWQKRKPMGIWVWVLCFLIQAVFPFIMQWDLATAAVTGFGPATVDGVNTLSFLVFIGLFAILPSLVWAPFAIRAQFPKSWSVIFGLTALALYIVCCVSTPYSSKYGYHPAKLVFAQDVDASTGFSQMTFYGVQQVKRQIGMSWMLQELLLNCRTNVKPFGSQITYPEACSILKREDTPMPASILLEPFGVEGLVPPSGFGLDMTQENYVVDASTNTRKAAYKVYVLQSSICRVKAVGQYQNIRLRVVGMQYDVVNAYEQASGKQISEVWIVKRSFGAQLWTFEFEALVQAKSKVKLTVTCMYDDVERQIPYFQQIQNSMPAKTTLASFGVGLLRVHKSVAL